MLEPFEDEVKSLLKKSVSKSTWNVYENAIQSFERFRNQFGIENIWSPPIDHLINYIAFLSEKSYSPATAKSYISGISYKIKINNLEDRTQSFILKKMLQGMQRLDKKNDSRKQLIFCRKLYQYYAWFVVRTMKPICCLQHFYLPFLVF